MNTRNDDFLERLEAAGAEEFAGLVCEGDETALREYFGGDFEEIRSLAEPVRSGKLGHAVVLHGILGAHLAEASETVWLNPFRLLRGGLDRLRPGAAAIQPRGLLKRYYGRQLLTLSARWNVRAFAYDWRLTLDESARVLAAAIDGWFPPGETVHLVAHSMGGLVARAFLALRPAHSGRLVMLGTPNRGSYAIPQLLHGMHSLLTPLALLDLKHSREEVLDIIRAWPGVHEMDPANPRLARLPVDGERMTYIAGSGHRTAVAIRDAGRLGEAAGYGWSAAGDGTVPHCLGLLEGVTAYYADEEHGALPGNARVLEAIGDILATGRTARLATAPEPQRGEGREASAEMAGFLAVRPATIAAASKRRITVYLGAMESAGNVDALIVAHYEGVTPHLADSRPALKAMADRLPSELGEPFYIPAQRGEGPPLLVIGMGGVGRFGEAQLAILVERLVWAARLFGIAHAATTLVGAGAGNLSLEQAARIWRHGLANAELRVTFYERDAGRAARLAQLFETATVSGVEPADAASNEPPARLSVEQTRAGYRLALLTRDASIPEREIAIDHALIEEVNAKLGEPGGDAGEWAECLLRLLLPAELQQAARRAGPVVVACDRAAAQIHWERLHPAVSRQFRSQRAPFRSVRDKTKRLLVVADTREDAPLPAAAEEGRALAESLRERGLDVTALIGPREATRAAVVRELLLRPYDAMHYAGHCHYVPADPGASGWLFTGGAVLSAREMERMERVPAFIFSNACESGVVAAGPAGVPGFAETIFAIGVRNFIATSRPVGDGAAARFARAFYAAADGPLHDAMRAGRAAAGGEGPVWQHYGNPATVLF